jgi:hypothetical protein
MKNTYQNLSLKTQEYKKVVCSYGHMKSFKTLTEARLCWLTTVILATQEAEIRRITVQSQPWENSSRDPI